MLPYVLELQNVNKSFSKQKLVLRNFNLQIEKGEMVCLFAPNGAGKTTILLMCIGLETFDSGEILLEGKHLSQMSAAEKGLLRNQKIGVVFQKTQLISYLTVFDNIMLPFYIRGTPAKEARKQVEEVLTHVGIKHMASKKPFQLSGGEQQLVGVARAIVYQPTILLVDEPTTYLDQENKQLVWSMLESLHSSGKTIIVASHDQEIRNKCRCITWNLQN
ncbi:MAG: Lipoprotein-releasing system ATP-binding protein LolD [Dehalococcoidia bacterium]|nr:Lipoprotein-releasing system ATP-binding protein LolD [Bacillota bacterium]MBT9141101.1 Lipoprotein-releasing system ATP-binding protein LolD [Bacillota bacterium]MBT9142662.1 Lipoprotein-releasing system ATP-binding protein LolD [Bacillota bacterium]